MIVRLALRSLATRPVRTALLACGFGFGIAVMAALLGVGEVILEQAHSPALQGGGDVVIRSQVGALDNARALMTGVLRAPDLARRIVGVSPSTRHTVYVMTDKGAIAAMARSSIPSLERAVDDPEVKTVTGWTDGPADGEWSAPQADAVLRSIDRFHPIPDVPDFQSSWAEWLYFNGRTLDGRVRFYLTFLVGPASSTPGRRSAGVRLQVERDGRTTSYAAGGEVDEAAVLDRAPDLDVAGNHVRLDGLTYRIALALPGATGEIALEAAPGHSLLPATIRGARGWVTGYVAPALSATVRGSLLLDHERVVIENAAGYHDHNWGFWEGVRWQWGQVAHDDVSLVYGRVFPPASVADPDRMPGFLGVLGAAGPLGFSTTVSIQEGGGDATSRRTVIRAKGAAMDLEVVFTAERLERTTMSKGPAIGGAGLDFLQLGGEYRVTGHVGDRPINFTARGAAETFERK